MSFKLKKIILNCIIICNILTLFACSVNTKTFMTYETMQAQPAAYGSVGFSRANSKMMAVNDSIEISEEAEFGNGAISNQKIIRTVDLNTETKTFDESIEWLKSHITTYEGIIDNSYIDSGNMDAYNYRRNAHFTIRVRAEKLDDFLSVIGNNLNITFRNENTQDVTEEYDDTESRIATLKLEEEKLNELMTKAKSVEDMIKIEEKLSDVRAELRNISRKLARLDRKVVYSTINISISEVKDLTELTPADDFSKENIIKQIRKNFEDTKKYLISLLVLFITHLPAIIAFLIAILILMIIIVIFKAVIRKKKKIKVKSKNNKVEKTDKEEVVKVEAVSEDNKDKK